MDLEIGRLDLRYAGLCARQKRLEADVLLRMSEAGQQTPVVVVVEAGQWVVIDGFKQVRGVGTPGRTGGNEPASVREGGRSGRGDGHLDQRGT